MSSSSTPTTSDKPAAADKKEEPEKAANKPPIGLVFSLGQFIDGMEGDTTLKLPPEHKEYERAERLVRDVLARQIREK